MGEGNDNARTRTFSWEDPRALAEAARGLTGLEFLKKVASGDLPRPPISALMNFGLGEVGEGRAARRASYTSAAAPRRPRARCSTPRASSTHTPPRPASSSVRKERWPK